jgi:uncharacterized RDD family membrane protein YckC
MENFYVKDKDIEKGPFTFEELTDGRLEPNDLVRTEFTQWAKASDILDFAEYFRYEGYYFPTEINLAGFGIRALAYLIDYFFITALFRVLSLVFADYLPKAPDSIDFNSVISTDDLNSLLILQGVAFATTFVYNLVGYLTPLSATVGQYLCRLIVVDAEGKKLGFGKAVIRSLVKVFSTLFCGAGFWVVLFNQHKQSLHDLAAKTYVIRKDVF